MRCELEGITVYYEEYGEGRPLLCLHGWPNDHRIIADLVEPHFERRPGWRRIYPDLPGMGRTPGTDWLTTQDQMLDVVLAFVDAVIQSRKVAEAIKGIMPAIRGADHAFLARLEQANAFSFDVDALAEPFYGPTLILTGRQDHLCGYRNAWGIVESYPRATYAVLDRAGHFLFWEQDELCAALTREWLDRIEEHIRAATP